MGAVETMLERDQILAIFVGFGPLAGLSMVLGVFYALGLLLDFLSILGFSIVSLLIVGYVLGTLPAFASAGLLIKLRDWGLKPEWPFVPLIGLCVGAAPGLLFALVQIISGTDPKTVLTHRLNLFVYLCFLVACFGATMTCWIAVRLSEAHKTRNPRNLVQ